MKSDMILSLIKEVVKNEVKQQVKEELAKLIKSGAVTLNKEKKQTSMMSIAEVTQKQMVKKEQPKQVKEFTKNPMLNEILNMTSPFSASERVEGGGSQSSILDMMQPTSYEEDGWETMDYRTQSIPQELPSTGNTGLDALNKALNRDYSDLTKVFSKQEKEKGLR